MKQSINIIIQLDKKTKKLRDKFHPEPSKIKPHITLAYPFETKKQQKLKNHITNCLKEVEPFDISLKKISKSYPFIQFRVKKGKRKMRKIQKSLNSGILNNPEEKRHLKYPPHITIGIQKQKPGFNKAVREIKKEKPSLNATIKKIILIKKKKKNKIKNKKDFGLR